MHNMAYCTYYESIMSAMDSSESKRGVLIFAIFKVGDIIVPEEIRHFHILLIVTNIQTLGHYRLPPAVLNDEKDSTNP